MPQQSKNQVFISYSHEDGKKWLDKLQIHLKPLIRDTPVTIWADTQLHGGDLWKQEIETALSSASVAVLLVTPGFLASDFIDKNELRPLLDAAKERGLKILWVPAAPSNAEAVGFSEYQAVTNPKRPLAKLRAADLNEELAKIARAVFDAAKPAATEIPSPVKVATAAAGNDSRSVGGTAPQANDITGTWYTADDFKVEFYQSGEIVTGTYSRAFDGLAGTIEGRFDGRVFKGSYETTNSANEILATGSQTLILKGNKLEGPWSAHDRGRSGLWTLTPVKVPGISS